MTNRFKKTWLGYANKYIDEGLTKIDDGLPVNNQQNHIIIAKVIKIDGFKKRQKMNTLRHYLFVPVYNHFIEPVPYIPNMTNIGVKCNE